MTSTFNRGRVLKCGKIGLIIFKNGGKGSHKKYLQRSFMDGKIYGQSLKYVANFIDVQASGIYAALELSK